MKKARSIIPSIILFLLGAQDLVRAQVIVSFQGNGQLSWTNAASSNALFRVEWAAQAIGPWYRNFDNIGSLDSRSATGFTVAVPMFYRVVMTTNQPPPGMVWIEGGTVELGQTGIAEPVHTNQISGFWMDEMEVKKTLWDQVYTWAITNGYTFDNAGGAKGTNHPVHTVSWFDCVKWCNARSQKEGLTPCYYIDPFFFNPYKTGNVNISNEWVSWNSGGYRLPTEAEWEKAARGGRQRRRFPWGLDTISHSQANYFANTNAYAYDISPTPGLHPTYDDAVDPTTSPVGSFPANGYGLHDMAGNIFEWCWDWLGAYSTSFQIDPRGPAVGTFRVLRGGSFNISAIGAQVAYQYQFLPTNITSHVGFRCARGP